MKISNLELSNHISNALNRAGIDSVEQVQNLSDSELRSIRGISDKRIAEIFEAIYKSVEPGYGATEYVTTNKRCRDCKYKARFTVGGAKTRGDYFCRYILYNYESRGCSVKDCTKFEPYKQN